MAAVFVSYAREDRDLANALADALGTLGVECWFDRDLEIGGSFQSDIDRKLNECGAIIVLWTDHSVDSKWVNSEALIGFDQGKLVPIQLGDARVPAPYSSIHTVQLADKRLSAGNETWLAVLSRIGKLVERPGLAEWLRLQESRDPYSLKVWARENPDDPHCDDAWARIEALEIEDLREKLRRQRIGEEPIGWSRTDVEDFLSAFSCGPDFGHRDDDVREMVYAIEIVDRLDINITDDYVIGLCADLNPKDPYGYGFSDDDVQYLINAAEALLALKRFRGIKT